MPKVYWFLLVEVAIVLIPALLMFKNLRSFLKSFYQYLIRDFFLFHRKRWMQLFNNSVNVDGYLLVVIVLTVINVFIFRMV